MVAGTGLAIYDGFSFPMGTGTMFLMLGMAGCAYRLQRVEQPPPSTRPTRPSDPDPAVVGLTRAASAG